MKITAYEKEKLGVAPNKKTYILNILDEFLESGMDCVKIEGWTHASVNSCVNTIHKAIKRYNKGNVRVITRSGEVFLIKTE